MAETIFPGLCAVNRLQPTSTVFCRVMDYYYTAFLQITAPRIARGMSENAGHYIAREKRNEDE